MRGVKAMLTWDTQCGDRTYGAYHICWWEWTKERAVMKGGWDPLCLQF